MKTVLTLVAILMVVHHAASQCVNIKQYNTTLVPACDPHDVRIKWPNYAEQTTYYVCYGVHNPQLVSCPSREYFAYVLQKCVTCESYIPPVKCNDLKTQNPPKCVNINDGGDVPTQSPATLPTPHYPTTVSDKPTKPPTPGPSPTPPKTPATPATPSTPSTGKTSKPTQPTPPLDTSTTPVPLPSSPFTSDPGVPMPPTPDPTPPSVSNEPPYLPNSRK